MLKTSKKSLLVVALLLCIGGGGLATYGFIYIPSNIVHVDVQYTVALTSEVIDSSVKLTATVKNGLDPVEGITVDFYYSTDSGANYYNFASQLTNVDGVAEATYTVTVNGAYDFKAVATVP